MLERLNRASHALGANTIATVLLAYLDRQNDGSHVLQWSNAGHPSPSVLTADGRVIELPGTDPLLGARHRHPRNTHHHQLAPGATLLMHTDGLVETRDGVIDDGFARLRQFLSGQNDVTPATLADQLVDYADTRIREDDVALIIARPR
ncbi:serine/threonine-protein phosphatase [Actinoplanes sp. TRM 88003]|uniref:Serine/threonine-protein phosphatase n=1 Tax=Paractinoplanes aksuensis TaxID=2939490 RepID=A0ABT1E720_9ACTN|nr:PP2C family protein-serine/threonine phosphatase [Actinoplanes aksuensis]MCO8277930.1 serine/threonine-protein phosphatase [Actinoplanes aksuensis]